MHSINFSPCLLRETIFVTSCLHKCWSISFLKGIYSKRKEDPFFDVRQKQFWPPHPESVSSWVPVYMFLSLPRLIWLSAYIVLINNITDYRVWHLTWKKVHTSYGDYETQIRFSFHQTTSMRKLVWPVLFAYKGCFFLGFNQLFKRH